MGNLENLPLFPAGWGQEKLGFSEKGNAFWNRVESVTSDSSLDESLDNVLSGRAAPRVWLLLHEPDSPAMSTAAAMAFARELCSRGQMTLILDCDESSAQLTKWADREDEEGWIDLTRYGASLTTCGEPLPFTGRRGYLLGVGSFCPTDITAKEIEQLLKRLKRQADDVFLVAPANEQGLQWAQHAHIRLLCLDRQQDVTDNLQAISDTMEISDQPITGIIGFGLPKSAKTEADVKAAATVAAAVDVDTKPEEVTVKVEESPEKTTVESADLSADKSADKSSDKSKWNEIDDLYNGTRPDGGAQWATRKSNSGVFWGIAITAVIAIVAAGGYYYKFIRVPPNGHFGNATGTTLADSQLGTSSLELAANAVVSPAEYQNEDPAETPVEQAVDSNLPENVDSIIGEESSDSPTDLQTDVAEALEEQTPAIASVNISRAEESQTPADSDQTTGKDDTTPGTESTEAVETTPEPAAVVFDMSPYLVPVGQAGWAIHVYSFRDSLQANKQERQLERRGFHTSTRAVEIAENGRYYRVFLGSFESKAQAVDAKSTLLDKLRVDWARVAKF